MARSYKSKQDTAVKAILGDYPIKDAKQPFRFTVKQVDIDQGASKDPHNCAIARAVQRYTGVKAIAIFHTVSYIPFDKRGDDKHVIERFVNDLPTKRAIVDFDLHGKFFPGEYKFNPPSQSCKLGAQTAYVKRRKKEGRKQEVRGHTVKSNTWDRNPKPKFLGVRNGTGLVSFTKQEEKKETRAS
jgi:hypothetical protein